MATNVEERVRRVVVATFRLPAASFSDDLRMSDPPAWDSLGHMELVAAVEAEFGVRFPLYLLPDLTTIPAVVAAVVAHSPTN